MGINRPIAIILMLFITLAMVFFLVVPQYKQFDNLRGELGKKTAEYNAKFEYFLRINELYADLQSRKAAIKKIDDALPEGANFGQLAYFLQKKGDENGVMFKGLFLSKSGSSGQKGGGIKDIVVSFSVTGTYSALQSFIISLEKSSRLFDITSISFGSGSTGAPDSSKSSGIEQTYSFSLQIKTHSY